jgi:hypothetical protein
MTARRKKPQQGGLPVSPETEGNGQLRPRRRRKPHARADQSVGPEPVVFPGDTMQYTKDDLTRVDWYHWPWIARGIYTLIVGHPSAGKSTFGASLAAKSHRSLILPGEEDVKRVVLPRLLAADADLSRVSFLRPDNALAFPRDGERFIDILQQTGADFVLIDPLDSYLGDSVDENHNGPVRRVLDCFARAAEATGIALVVVRHPGKAAQNLLAGSRAFRSHPRSILQLTTLAGVDDKGILSAYKPPFGIRATPIYYELVGAEGEAKRFVSGEEAPYVRVEEAVHVCDRIDRSKIDEAEELVRLLLADGKELTSKEIYLMAAQDCISDRLVRYAALRLCVTRTWSGRRHDTTCKWRLPG